MGIWPADFEGCPRSSRGPTCGWKETRGNAAGSPAPFGPVSSDPAALWLPADCCSNLCRHGVVVTAGEHNHGVKPGVKLCMAKANCINTSNSGSSASHSACQAFHSWPNKKANRASCMCSYSWVRRTGRPPCSAFEVQMFTTVSTNKITSAANSPEDRDISNINH